MPATVWLDRLIEHEIAYSGMIARCERTDYAVFLHAPQAVDYLDANRAVRLRTGRLTADAVAREVADYYRARGQRPVADVDPVAESQGIGAALRAIGLQPVGGSRLLMRYGLMAAPAVTSRAVVEVVPNETGAGEASEWIETAIADDIGWPDESLWRTVAEHEARFHACRLYLARLNGHAAGVCDLFQHGGWGRIDSVVTRPEARRNGVASLLVARAVADSVTSGNDDTYLFTEPGSDAQRLYSRLGFDAWHVDALRRYRG